MDRLFAVAVRAVERARCADERAYYTRDADDRARAAHYARRANRLIDQIAWETGRNRPLVATAVYRNRISDLWRRQEVAA